MKKARLTPIDGKDPNLAIMQLSSWLKAQGYEVFFNESVSKGMFEPDYDAVYASAIFTKSQPKIEAFLSQFPNAILGGTWVFQNEAGVERVKRMFPNATILGLNDTVESHLGLPEYGWMFYDYEIYPEVDYAIAFTQRGCQLKCSFCSVGQKEGRNISLPRSISEWLRMNPRNSNKLLLQDNDFTNQPAFEQRCHELIELGTKVCINQGLNVRLIDYKQRKMRDTATNKVDARQAALLAQCNLRDRKFAKRRIYTAWDNAKDERIFWEGIDILCENGFRPDHIMVYFLTNYWQKGLTEDVWHRFARMADFGLKPFCMIYDETNADRELRKFQEWVNQGHYYSCNGAYMDSFRLFEREGKTGYLNRKRFEASVGDAVIF